MQSFAKKVLMSMDQAHKMDAGPAAAAGAESKAHPSCCGQHAASGQFAWMPFLAAAGKGALAGSLLLLFYFGLLTVLSGWRFTLDQFNGFWPFILALSAGFAIQVGLFFYLRQALSAPQSGKVLAVTGSTSGAAMVSCCAHYLANLLPVLGIAGLASLIGQYQIQLFWAGLTANLAGIVYMSRKLAVVWRKGMAVQGVIAGLLVLTSLAFLPLAVLPLAVLPMPAFANDKPLLSITSSEGQVTVVATPLALAPQSKIWSFQLTFDTHSVTLDQDLPSAVILAAPDGREQKPMSWEGDPPGGHHRKGVLKFEHMNPRPPSISLKVRNVGPVRERSFTWPLEPPR